MKMLALLAAGLVAGAVVPVADAGAQPVTTRVVTTTSHTVRHNNWHNGRRASWRTVCRNQWRHHHQVRTCSRVRYWG